MVRTQISYIYIVYRKAEIKIKIMSIQNEDMATFQYVCLISYPQEFSFLCPMSYEAKLADA